MDTLDAGAAFNDLFCLLDYRAPLPLVGQYRSVNFDRYILRAGVVVRNLKPLKRVFFSPAIVHDPLLGTGQTIWGVCPKSFARPSPALDDPGSCWRALVLERSSQANRCLSLQCLVYSFG
jgi:hypothetical protein